MTESDPPASPERRGHAVPAFIAGTCVFAALTAWWGYRVDGGPRDFVALAILGFMAIASWLVQVDVVAQRVRFAGSSIIALACIVIVGPVGGAIINAVSFFLQFGRRAWHVRLFNAAMGATFGSLGGLAYLGVGGARDLTAVHGGGAMLVEVGLPLIVADVVQCLVNTLLISGIMWADRGVPFGRFAVQMLTTSGLAYVGYGLIGFLFVILWVPADLGPFSAVLILIPLYVARWAFGQYGDEQQAHDRTLQALVAAVEARDPYTVGHSARIERLASWMAPTFALTSQQREALRIAALLHDIGQVGAPAGSRSAEGVDPRELVALSRHTVIGAEMIEEIDFLLDSVDGVRYHHERYDGQGYPEGLAGEQIPVLARIIAVADAFDSLTTTRAYRAAHPVSEALGIIRVRAGTQFDPVVVAALERAMERHSWTASDPSPAHAGPGPLDHDDPQTSDLMVAWLHPAGSRVRAS
ncbi:MAG: HD domain-containing phosphohydrolase [Dermatophilaceae bacterium]